jgi:hypothetical protein
VEYQFTSAPDAEVLKFVLMPELFGQLGELFPGSAAQDYLFKGGIRTPTGESGEKKRGLAVSISNNFLVRQQFRPVGYQRAPQHLSSGPMALLLFIGRDVGGQSCRGRQVLACQCFEQLRKMIYGWHRRTLQLYKFKPIPLPSADLWWLGASRGGLKVKQYKRSMLPKVPEESNRMRARRRPHLGNSIIPIA